MKKLTPARVDPVAFWRLVAYGISVFALLAWAEAVCLLRVLEPHHRHGAANIARWIWFVVQIFITLFFLLGEMAPRLAPSPRPPRVFSLNTCGLLISVATLVALLMGHLAPALLLSYGWSSLGSLHKLRLAPIEPSANLRRIKRISNTIVSLFFPLLAAALFWHSLPIAYGLFWVQIVGAMITIPLFRDAYRQHCASPSPLP